MRFLRVALTVIAIAAIGVFSFLLSQRFMPGPPRLPAREALLLRQTIGLTKLVEDAEKGTLLNFQGVLIAVDQVLVQDLLGAVVPVQADVGSGFNVVINAADAAFGDGVALVRLTGRATVAGASVGSEVTVFGSIDVVRLDPVSGILQCNVSIVGVEAENAAALGRGDPVGRLTEALTHGGIALLLGDLEIPVSVQDRLSIPAVESKRLQIPAEDLPIRAVAQQIKVFAGRLWVFVDVNLIPPPKVAALKSPGSL